MARASRVLKSLRYSRRAGLHPIESPWTFDEVMTWENENGD